VCVREREFVRARVCVRERVCVRVRRTHNTTHLYNKNIATRNVHLEIQHQLRMAKK